MLHDFFQHISQSKTISSRDRVRIANSKVIEFVHIRHIFLKAVNLIHHQHNRFARTSQHIGDLAIRVNHPLLDIHQK